MAYASLRECVVDLERHGHLVRIDTPVSAHLEIAEIQRRVYEAGGPALYFSRVQGCELPMLGNLFGSLDRARFVFRDTLASVQRLVELKVDPGRAWQKPLRYWRVPWTAFSMLPARVGASRAPVLARQTQLSKLPQLVCWPDDGGAFITLPQVYTEHPDQPGPMHANLGMYRIQLSGGRYAADREVGMHYQIHRGIGVHHSAALQRGERLRVNVFVGGPPAMTLAAVMPLPEGLTELLFAGALGGRRIRLCRPGNRQDALPIHADADFCLQGYIEPGRMLPEGPFGDHLGYYSLAHDFPVLTVERVFHREDAIWPFTVVGRPPQEDTTFGALIHEITGPVIPTVVHGVRAVNAVDAAGVHPLLLAIGSERYTPYADSERPAELLTQANAILGQGQMSLAKYLLIAAEGDDPALDIHDIASYFAHVLARFDPRRDLHFQTQTTIDTLDYSGGALNQGSKLILAARGKPRRKLPTAVPSSLRLPDGFRDPAVCLPGVLALSGPRYAAGSDGRDTAVEAFCAELDATHPINAFPLVVICDDSDFCARTLNNFLWVTFTRSNPATDVQGIGAALVHKHWGCTGSVVIDARHKPWHAPPLIADPKISARVDELAKQGGPLHGIF
jgi:4-hydroxy-3-polyprenylbenzoate decarboxylase